MRQTVCFFSLVCALLGAWLVPSQHAVAAGAPERPRAASAAGKNLHLGIVPFYSAPALLRVHRALRDYLSRMLGMDIIVYSARNHERFLENALSGQYDIVISPAHFLSMLADGGFTPLVRYRNPFEVLLVVRKDSAIETVADLRGRRIGLPDRLSFYHVLGMKWLNSLDLRPGEDYVLKEQASHMAMLLAVDAGQIDVAVTARPILSLLDQNLRAHFRALDIGHPVLPSLTTLVRGDLGGAEIKRLRAALEAFPQSQEGRRFFADSGYGGYVPATAGDVEAARHYEPLVRRLLTPAREPGAETR